MPMKRYIASFIIFFLLVLSFGNQSQAVELVTGKTFLVFNGEGAFAPEINGFYTNYTSAGNRVINGSDMTMDDLRTKLTADVDALFLAANNFEGVDLSFIKDWFDLGNKLLWVAGDSDFGAFFIADDLNPVLEEVGSVLRLDAGAVDDPVINDGASYRVIANQLGEGRISDAIRAEIDGELRMPFHGPTSVYYVNNGVPSDLREATLDNVEVVVKSSPHASAIDQDLSAGAGDFYASIGAVGDLPLLVVETMGSNMVVVSGEGVFKDYKFMYGNSMEKSGEFHHGSIVVDTVISFMPSGGSIVDTSSNSSVGTETTTPALSLPLSLVPFSIATLVVVRKRMK